MATGRYTSDLEPGDVLGPLQYTMSRFVVREYCHAVEMHQACFQEPPDPIAPPTLVHLDKLRLYRHACPGGAGPSARVHYEYDATFHAPVRAGTPLTVSGTVTERYTKRGRDYVVMAIDLRAADDNRLLIAYRDTVILSYTAQPAADAEVRA